MYLDNWNVIEVFLSCFLENKALKCKSPLLFEMSETNFGLFFFPKMLSWKERRKQLLLLTFLAWQMFEIQLMDKVALFKHRALLLQLHHFMGTEKQPFRENESNISFY